MSPLRCLAAAAAALLCTVAHGATIGFDFGASGFGVSGPCAGELPNCVDAFTVGTATRTLGGTGSWSQYLSFTLAPSSGAVSGTWSLVDDGAAFNDLAGTFTGQWSSGAGGAAQVAIRYVVTGGTGIFAGATGGGQSVMAIDGGFNYVETGAFSVTAVPEPASWALWLGGMVVAGLAGRRRAAG